MVQVQRLFALEEVPQEADNSSIEPDSCWPSAGKVEFIDATLRYRPTTDLVLKSLSFEVEPGTKIGIVGRTGAGKSTICLSLSRIVELCAGRIEIDGVDISKVSIEKVREKVTVISQDPTLFKGSIRNNMDPFN